MTWYTLDKKCRRTASTAAGVTPKDWGLRCTQSLPKSGCAVAAAHASRWPTSLPTPLREDRAASSVRQRSAEPGARLTPQPRKLDGAASTPRTPSSDGQARNAGASSTLTWCGLKRGAGMPTITTRPSRSPSAGRQRIKHELPSACGPARSCAEPSHAATSSSRPRVRCAAPPRSGSKARTSTTAVRSMSAGFVVRATFGGIERSRRASDVEGRDLAIRRGRAPAGA
jgi:hypothetical protein